VQDTGESLKWTAFLDNCTLEFDVSASAPLTITADREVIYHYTSSFSSDLLPKCLSVLGSAAEVLRIIEAYYTSSGTTPHWYDADLVIFGGG
jgi:hypothetical protein